MKSTLLLTLFALSLSSQAMASDLKECQRKIEDMVSHVSKSAIAGPSGNVDQYHMSQDRTCGIENLTEEGYFTVTEFKPEGQEGFKKFETILLAGDNGAYAGGRVKGSVSCEIAGDSVTYTTKLPMFSDGVRSPFQVKTLKISQSGNHVSVKLKAKLMVLSSVAGCELDY